MPRNRMLSLAALAALLMLSLVGSAKGAPVTLGYPLTGTFMPNHCDESCTLIAVGSSDSGAVFTAPSDGAIVRWRLLQGSHGYSYELRVIAPGASPLFTGAGTSAAVSPAGTGLETFPTFLPIKAGEQIGVDLEPGALVGFNPLAGSYGDVEPPLADGATDSGGTLEGEVSFNADFEPAPTVIAVAPADGVPGTQVTIAGTAFGEASAVKFGSNPTTFNVVSENQIIATAPFGAGTVPITVTTPYGTATAPQTFTYAGTIAPPSPAPPTPPARPTPAACVVPKLTGKTLKSAKKRIRGADCRVGSLTKRKGARAKTGEVVGQVPKPGTSAPAGTKVKVTLGP